ncbi:MAG: hypothetical protein V3T42_09050, partial [Nitrospirales bacterium]
ALLIPSSTKFFSSSQIFKLLVPAKSPTMIGDVIFKIWGRRWLAHDGMNSIFFGIERHFILTAKLLKVGFNS